MTAAELEALYRRLERPIYNVVYRRVWRGEEAQEIAQEAFARLWRMRGRVRMETVEALVYRIALNLAASHLRARARRRRWLPFLEAPEPAEPVVVKLEVQQAIDALPDDARSVLLLTELAGLSYAQVAEALSIPIGTVGSRRHRALQLLRKTFGKDVDDERARLAR